MRFHGFAFALKIIKNIFFVKMHIKSYLSLSNVSFDILDLEGDHFPNEFRRSICWLPFGVDWPISKTISYSLLCIRHIFCRQFGKK